MHRCIFLIVCFSWEREKERKNDYSTSFLHRKNMIWLCLWKQPMVKNFSCQHIVRHQSNMKRFVDRIYICSLYETNNMEYSFMLKEGYWYWLRVVDLGRLVNVGLTLNRDSLAGCTRFVCGLCWHLNKLEKIPITSCRNFLLVKE